MKRSKRKQEIYSKAAQLFREKGYSATSIRDIAENVGLEPSSLYSHIKSKEEILVEICFECADMFEHGMKNILDKGLKPMETIMELVELHCQIAFCNPSSVTVFNDEWRHLPQEYLLKFLKKRKIYEDSFKKIINEGIREKSIEKISSNTAINLIINSIKWLSFLSSKISRQSFEERKEEIKKFIRKGLQMKRI